MKAIEMTYERELAFLKQNNEKLKDLTVMKPKGPVTPERIHTCREKRKKTQPKNCFSGNEDLLIDLHRVLRTLEKKIARIKKENV
jgi:hypothetical protein